MVSNQNVLPYIIVNMQRFEKYEGFHENAKALVIGCGTSAAEVKKYDLKGLVTIGVNDSHVLTRLDYLMVIDYPKRFSEKRVKSILNADYGKFLTHVNAWKVDESKKVLYILGERKLRNLEKPGVLDYSNSSPYVAVVAAHKMGCGKIGVIGVDFTKGHFYDEGDGDHELIKKGRADVIKRDWDVLGAKLSKAGSNIYNLSDESILSKVKNIKNSDFKSYVENA